MKKVVKIPLDTYKDYGKARLRVFRITAKPKSAPIDFNLAVLFEKAGWQPSDRFRFWYAQDFKEIDNPLLSTLANSPAHILIRKLDREEDSFCICRILLDGCIEILSNDEDYASTFFTDLFVNVPPTLYTLRNWGIRRKWVNDATSVGMFSGSLAGALGWGKEIPREIEESVVEAIKDYEIKNWHSCVVMCRRCVEAVMKLAYTRFFGQEPKTAKGRDLDLAEIIKRFESGRPDIIPRHLLNIVDSIRNLGNVPGAHPKAIPKYKFTRSDALLALTNLQSFVNAYFTKIDKELGSIYTLRIKLDRV
jgi:HEPN domain-containing protein